MAKTNFQHGTIVTPAFLNAINSQTNTGTDNDGDAPKVRLQDIDGFGKGSFTMLFGEFSDGDKIATIQYSVFYPYNVGTLGIVVLMFDKLVGAGENGFGLKSKEYGVNVMPEALRPVSDVHIPVSIRISNTGGLPGVLNITPDGDFVFSRVVYFDGIIAKSPTWLEGNKGWDQMAVQYPINLV